MSGYIALPADIPDSRNPLTLTGPFALDGSATHPSCLPCLVVYKGQTWGMRHFQRYLWAFLQPWREAGLILHHPTSKENFKTTKSCSLCPQPWQNPATLRREDEAARGKFIITLSWQKADRLVSPITATETINLEQILKECFNNPSLLSLPDTVWFFAISQL